MKHLLDSYDKKILMLLQADSSYSQKDLAEAVNLSTSAVNRRVLILESERFITRNVSIVDPVKCGAPVTVIVEVKVNNRRADLLDIDQKRFLECRNVNQLYSVTGDVDYILIMNVKDVDEYTSLAEDLFQVSNNIKSVKTMFSVNTIKRGLEIFVK